MNSEADCPGGEELDVLFDLVEPYECKHVPVDYPCPAAIQFCMGQEGLRHADPAPFIGSRAKVSKVFTGKPEVAMPKARALQETDVDVVSLVG